MSSMGFQRRQDDLLALAHQLGVFRARDLMAHGIARDYLGRLVTEGRLKRVDRGLYALPEEARSVHYPFAEAVKRVLEGVICLRSALMFHHLIPQPLEEVWVAIHRDTHPPKMTTLSLHIVRFSGLASSFGIEVHYIGGVLVRVYSPPKPSPIASNTVTSLG
jgi:predicted transcriptional regulator of viral defense system